MAVANKMESIVSCMLDLDWCVVVVVVVGVRDNFENFDNFDFDNWMVFDDMTD